MFYPTDEPALANGVSQLAVLRDNEHLSKWNRTLSGEVLIIWNRQLAGGCGYYPLIVVKIISAAIATIDRRNIRA